MTETTVVCLCFSYLEKEVAEDGYWLHFSETSCFNTQACQSHSADHKAEERKEQKKEEIHR